MNAERREERVNTLKLCSSQGKSEEKIRIECEAVRGINTAASEVQIFAPERRRLHDVTSPEEVPQTVETRLAAFADGFTVSIHPVHVAEGDANCRITHHIRNSLQRTRQIHIV